MKPKQYTLVARQAAKTSYEVVGYSDDFDKAVEQREALLRNNRDVLIYLSRHFDASTLALLNMPGDSAKVDWPSVNKTRSVLHDEAYSIFDAEAAELVRHYEAMGLTPIDDYDLPIEARNAGVAGEESND